MRCSYCRSFTHQKDCPKYLEGRILPVYSAVHKLNLLERRAQVNQVALYSLPEAQEVLAQFKRLLYELTLGDNLEQSAE